MTNRNRFQKTVSILLSLFLFFGVVLMGQVETYAAASATKIGSKKVYASGSFKILLNDGSKTNTYTITVKWPGTTPSWSDLPSLSAANRKLNLSMSSSGSGAITAALGSTTATLSKTRYDGQSNSANQYVYLTVPIKITVPAGYDYVSTSREVTTSADDSENPLFGWSTSNGTTNEYDMKNGQTTQTVYIRMNVRATGLFTSTGTGYRYSGFSRTFTYKKRTYTIKYDANSGSGAPASQTKTYGTNLTLSSTKPTRTGYTFKNWNTAANGSGTSYSAGGSYTANAAVTLYAQWTINTYAVTFNANGGSGAPASQTKTYGTDLTLSSTKPTRTGYTFKNWNTAANGSGTTYAAGAKYTGNSALALYAQWTANTYTITYNANGGSGAPSAQTKTYGTDLTLSSTKPTRSGYIFRGWNTAANGSGTAYTAGAKYTANAAATLYAQWAETAKWQYNINGGRLIEPRSSSISVDANGRVFLNGALLELAQTDPINWNNPNYLNTEKTGYHVVTGKEWNSEPDGSGKSFDQATAYPEEDILTYSILYINWVPNTYTIRYHAGASDAEGYMPDQTVTYDETATLFSNSFTRPGFRVRGWNTEADGSGTSYGELGVIRNLSTVDGEVIDLYADWRPIEETEADIIVGKTLTTGATIDEFSFLVEAVEGWTNENESTEADGRKIPASEMPMPEGTEPGKTETVVTINGMNGNRNVLRTSSIGILHFEEPGWYMYRISEVIPDEPLEGVQYDETSYYAVVYVKYKEESGEKIIVSDITAWHNNVLSDKNRPDLTDISEHGDGGTLKSNDQKSTFGKVGHGTNSLAAYKFWNSQQSGLFRLTKNVTGALGDRTKAFEFTVTLKNAGANKSYPAILDGAEAVSGFTGDTFTTDAGGNASLTLRLHDDDIFEFEEMPLGTVITVREGASDHKPSCKVTATKGGNLGSDAAGSGSALSTGEITITDMDTYTAAFENEKTITTVTGVPTALPVGAGFAALAVLLLLIVRRRPDVEEW